MHEHAFQLFHVCEVAKIILYEEVTSRKVNSAAISTSCAPYNSLEERCYNSAHMENLDNFLSFPNHSAVCPNQSNSLGTQQSNDHY